MDLRLCFFFTIRMALTTLRNVFSRIFDSVARLACATFTLHLIHPSIHPSLLGMGIISKLDSCIPYNRGNIPLAWIPSAACHGLVHFKRSIIELYLCDRTRVHRWCVIVCCSISGDFSIVLELETLSHRNTIGVYVGFVVRGARVSRCLSNLSKSLLLA